MKVALLAGGTGGAKLAAGLATLIGDDLTIVCNTADDDEFWGLLVCPDTDSVIYHLAGLFNETAGFGVRDESFRALEMLGRLGEPTWFGLGDRDLGLHLLRASLLQRGLRLTEAVDVITQRLRIAARVVPMSDERVRTRILTDVGEQSLQTWFVRDRCAPRVAGVRFDGIDRARPSPEAATAVEQAEWVVIAPSNPVISIDPIIAVLRAHLDRRRVVAMSPVVGGRALKGPTVTMLEQLGEEATAVGVARRYRDVCSTFVLDVADGALERDIGALGVRTAVIDTVMKDADGERRVAAELLRVLESSPAASDRCAAP